MTLEQHIRLRIEDCGLFFAPQVAAMEYVKAHKRMTPMAGRWNHPYEPDNPLNATIWAMTRMHVGEWLDANFPEFPGREEFR